MLTARRETRERERVEKTERGKRVPNALQWLVSVEGGLLLLEIPLLFGRLVLVQS